MMIGKEMTLPLHLLYRPEDARVASAYTIHQYVADPQAHLRATFAWAQENLQANVKGQKAYYDKGDRVLIPGWRQGPVLQLYQACRYT